MFSQETADRICAELAEGKTLREVCRAEGMPNPSTVLRWKDDPKNGAFAQQYAQARETGYQLLGDEILDISDEPATIKRTTFDDGDIENPIEETAVDSAAVARNRLRVDSRKWLLSKMLPKVYGDKIEHEHKGQVSIVATSQDERI